MMIHIKAYLFVAVLLVILGLIGFLTRRNIIIQFLSVELMLQGIALNFIAYAHYHGNLSGQIFVLIIFAVAACESAIALVLILALYRLGKSLDTVQWQNLREPGQPATPEPVDLTPLDLPEPTPRLPKAGVEPEIRI